MFPPAFLHIFHFPDLHLSARTALSDLFPDLYTAPLSYPVYFPLCTKMFLYSLSVLGQQPYFVLLMHCSAPLLSPFLPEYQRPGPRFYFLSFLSFPLFLLPLHFPDHSDHTESEDIVCCSCRSPFICLPIFLLQFVHTRHQTVKFSAPFHFFDFIRFFFLLI